jgi:hypothetical protein
MASADEQEQTAATMALWFLEQAPERAAHDSQSEVRKAAAGL